MNKRNFLAFNLGLYVMGPLALSACGGGDPIDGDELATLTVHDILQGLSRRRFSSEDLVLAYLARAEKYEPHYNAFTSQNRNALEQARASDWARRSGALLGPLSGVPMVIKETMDHVGSASTMGWRLLSSKTGGHDLFPRNNAIVVQRLLDAGAIVLGKTNVPVFSDDGTRARDSWDGPTYNAIDRTLAPGASSSGTATAVAAGFAAAGMGEETGGSIQNPAAAQSLVGLKPTYGLVPTRGVTPLAGSTRDVVGPIAKTVRDAAILMDVMAGFSPLDEKTIGAIGRLPATGYVGALTPGALRGKRIGLYGPGWKSTPLSAETQTLYASAVRELTAMGAVVVADPFVGSGFAELALPGEPYDYSGTESAAYDLNAYLPGLGVASIAALKALVGMSPFDPEGPLSWYVDALPVLSASLADPSVFPDLSAFQALRVQYVGIFDAVMDLHRLDALVFPHATEALPLLASDVAISETTVSAINIAGLPGLTVPAGQYAERGAPFSLIFVGRHWSEPALLAMAHDYEQMTQHRLLPNLTLTTA